MLGAREKNGKKDGRREDPFGGEGTEVVDGARVKKSCGHWGGVATTMSEKARVSMRIPVKEFELFYLGGDLFGGARLQNVVELQAGSRARLTRRISELAWPSRGRRVTNSHLFCYVTDGDALIARF